MADMCVRMNLFKNWRIWNEEFFTIFLLRSRGVVGTPTCYSAMRCYDDAKASTSNAILSFPLEGLNTFFSSPQPSKSTSRNGFLQHCMMPSTALCYDDSFPFSLSLLLVNCRMCVIKVGSVQSRVGENGGPRKSINFINTAVPFLLFVLHANRSLFCWIIAPRCFSASHQTRLSAHFYLCWIYAK